MYHCHVSKHKVYAVMLPLNISDMFHHTEQNLHSKGLITLWVVSLAFFIFPRIFYFSSHFLFFLAFFIFPCVFDLSSRFFSRFFSRFLYQHVSIKNTRKNVSPTRDNFSILHYALNKERKLLTFFYCFMLAFLLINLTKTQPQHLNPKPIHQVDHYNYKKHGGGSLRATILP